ncbi:MAG: nitronate monooxygenase [Gammaproteobacteria bacterium]
MNDAESRATTRYSLNLHTPLLDILGCDLPILAAGMGGVARFELAAAVSAAGGLGCLGMVREPVAMIESQVQQLRDLTSRPFGVNLIPAATESRLLATQVDCVIDLKVPIACLFWDIDRDTMARLLEAGIVVMHQVGSVQDARTALAAGADVIIAQGYDAGGHVRGAIGTFSLVPEIAEISPVPVVAAGGIVSGRGLAAALMLGAQGVWCGSAFVSTRESCAHELHKQALVDAVSEDAVHTLAYPLNWPQNAPVRVLKNSITENYQDGRGLPRTRQIGEQDGKPVYLFSTDSPLRDAVGELDKMPLYAGQACGQIRHRGSAAEVVTRMVNEADQVFRHNLVEGNDDRGGHGETAGFSSSPCSLHEVSGEYAGHCSNQELIDLLGLLLKAERAGARICACSLKQAGTGRWRRLLQQIHRDEVRSCRALIGSIRSLGAQAHRETGDFFEKCMAVENLEERLLLLNRGQRWVVRKIKEVLPRVGQRTIAMQLEIMCNEHQHNIELASQTFETR